MEDNKEFAVCKFTSKRIVEMLEVGILVYQTDEESFKNQTPWTDLELRAFHENLRLACEEQEKGVLAESLWDIDATELAHHWGWRAKRKSAQTRVRLCPAPGCLFRPLIATKSADCSMLAARIFSMPNKNGSRNVRNVHSSEPSQPLK